MNRKNQENTSNNKIRFVLRKLIMQANMRDIELSRITNIPYSTLHALLNSEKVSPKVETLLPLAKYFNITINQLIGDAPLENEEQQQTIIPNEKEEIREWNPELFINCIVAVTKALNQKNENIGLGKALRITKEIYLYFLTRNEKSVDEGFVSWFVNHTLNS